MSETDDKPISKYDWGNEFLDMAKYGAMNGHSPTYIAELANLRGDMRRQFLRDITNPKTKLGAEFRNGKSLAHQDVETTIHTLQIAGDTDAMEVALKRARLEYITRMKEDLFGL
ncbi:MAG: hypothetical protein IJN06_07020 [Bacteroidales bacterium]|nr:hypothetical protein [Bacteroidales bacterium]